MTDAIGAGLTLADDVLKYFVMDPNGWDRLTVERKLDALHEIGKRAMVEKDWAAVDRCNAEYARLQRTTR